MQKCSSHKHVRNTKKCTAFYLLTHHCVCLTATWNNNDNHKGTWQQNILPFRIYEPDWNITADIYQRITQKLSLSKFNSASMTMIQRVKHNISEEKILADFSIFLSSNFTIYWCLDIFLTFSNEWNIKEYFKLSKGWGLNTTHLFVHMQICKHCNPHPRTSQLLCQDLGTPTNKRGLYSTYYFVLETM